MTSQNFNKVFFVHRCTATENYRWICRLHFNNFVIKVWLKEWLCYLEHRFGLLMFLYFQSVLVGKVFRVMGGGRHCRPKVLGFLADACWIETGSSECCLLGFYLGFKTVLFNLLQSILHAWLSLESFFLELSVSQSVFGMTCRFVAVFYLHVHDAEVQHTDY